MSKAGSVSHLAPIEDYDREALSLFDGWSRGDADSEWRFKWEHPRFRNQHVAEVRAATLESADARTVVAREHGFETWFELAAFSQNVKTDAGVQDFEAAVEAVVSGDVAGLKALLHRHPELVQARSARRHHATLLHYVAANGVEGGRQRTPRNAVEIATMLLDAGAEPDALADMYDARCTTMSMLVSSGHPADAGVQGALVEVLLDHGAALEGPGSKWQSSVMTALAFGYLATARLLAARGAPIDQLPAVAGLGRLEDARRLLAAADAPSRQVALALASQHGHVEVVRLLLEAGADPNRHNPEGFHSHSTPLHQAAWAGHADVVRLLVERGARLDVEDTVHHATPLGWAEYGHRTAIAEYLRQAGSQGR